MNATAESPVIDLGWVTVAGGPELQCTDGREVTGLPEEGWWVWPDQKYKDQSAGLVLNLHIEWTEPTTGQAGTLIANIQPAEQGVKWETCFIWYPSGKERDAEVPARGRGTSADFNAARMAVLTWRPEVSVIDGIQLWTDPSTAKGKALDLASGQLTWRVGEEKGQRVQWQFEPAGMTEVMNACGAWTHTLSGTAETLHEMLDQVSEAREQMRAAMRKYLLNF